MVTTIRKYTGGAYPYYEYACLSTDVKPVNLVPENSICHEIDTGKHFYLANGEWHQLPARGGECLPADFPAEGSANANKFLGFDANGDYTAKDAPSGGGAEKFVVTLTQDAQTEEWTADKTIAEIIAASEAGKEPVALLAASVLPEGVFFEIPCAIADEVEINSSEFVIVMFGGVVYEEHAEVVAATGFVEHNSDFWSVEIKDVSNSWFPSYSSSQNGKVLGVSSGSLAWADTNAPLIVTLTEDESTGNFVGDKTFGEVDAAMGAGKNVVLSGTIGASIKIVPNGIILDGSTYKLTIPFDGQFVVLQGAGTDYITVAGD